MGPSVADPRADGSRVLGRAAPFRPGLPVTVAVLIVLAPIHCRVDPSTNRIRYMMIGETAAVHQTATGIMLADPKIDLSLVPAGDVADVKTSKRFIRIYVPRSGAQLVGEYDVMELFDFVPHVLEPRHLEWMRDAIRDHGLGLALTEMGWYTITDWTGNDAAAWMATVLYEAYPCDLVLQKQNRASPYMDIVERTPLNDLPGFEKAAMTTREGHGIQIARPGSILHTVWRTGKEHAIVSGTFGLGQTLMIPMGWDNVPVPTRNDWDCFIDFVLNHAYYVARVRIPEDLGMIHRLREDFVRYADERVRTYWLLDFVAKFGANTHPVEAILAELQAGKGKAEVLYLGEEYEEAAEAMAEVLDGFHRVSEEAVSMRGRALLWVYITEYLVVTAFCILCGSMLWTLMVRRRLYREVSITRVHLEEGG